MADTSIIPRGRDFRALTVNEQTYAELRAERTKRIGAEVEVATARRAARSSGVARAFAAYWIIGLVVAGTTIARAINECPAFKITGAETLAFVATWPVAFIAYPFIKTVPTPVCGN